MVNYLARVGWSYDDKTELFTREELIRYFDLAGVNNSPARFSYDRLESINAHYIRHLEIDDLAQRAAPFLAESGITATASDLAPIVPLVQERIKTLGDIVERTDFFFVEELDHDHSLLVGKKMTAEQSQDALQSARAQLASLPDFAAATTEAAMRSLAEQLGLKAGQLFGIIRAAVTGKKVSPPLFETLEVLGSERSLARIDSAIQTLASGRA
jgi:glutamyl-tRNA synthetase